MNHKISNETMKSLLNKINDLYLIQNSKELKLNKHVDLFLSKTTNLSVMAAIYKTVWTKEAILMQTFNIREIMYHLDKSSGYQVSNQLLSQSFEELKIHLPKGYYINKVSQWVKEIDNFEIEMTKLRQEIWENFIISVLKTKDKDKIRHLMYELYGEGVSFLKLTIIRNILFYIDKNDIENFNKTIDNYDYN
jgi:hypothetical protein